MNLEWVTDPYHLTTMGETGSGKTVLGTQLFDQARRYGVFWNAQHERRVERVADVVVSSGADVLPAFREGHRKVCVSPETTDEAADHDKMVEGLFALGRQMENVTGSPDLGMIVVHDEAHDLGAGLVRMAKRGRKYGMKSVIASQEARNVSHSALTQCRYHIWVGQPTDFEQEYFKKYKLPFDRLRALHGDHTASVIRGGEIVAGPFEADSGYV